MNVLAEFPINKGENRTKRFQFARMLGRALESEVESGLANYPAVALLGLRQVGETSLALEVATELDLSHTSVLRYLDLMVDLSLD